MIFDSHYDAYKGVVAYVRVVDGSMQAGQALRLMSTGMTLEPLEVGVFRPGHAADRAGSRPARWATWRPG